MRMFAGATSMVLAVSVMSSGCATAGKTSSGVTDQAAQNSAASAADAMIYINGLS